MAWQVGDLVRSPTTLCNVFHSDNGDIEHECVAKEGDIGSIETLDSDGEIASVYFEGLGVWYADGFVKFKPVGD